MDDPLERLAALAEDLGRTGPPPRRLAELEAICSTARLVLGAVAVSVARVEDRGDESGLEYVAADGAGAGAIVGTSLPAGSGLAGFVVASGQSLAIDRVQDDPRFARDVAEATGYTPTSMLVVPVLAADGGPIGAISVLDRGAGTTGATVAAGDALEVTAAFARQAALVLPELDHIARIGPLLLRSVAEAVAAGDVDLAAALRRVADGIPGTDAEVARTAALLGELRERGDATAAGVNRVLTELLAISAAGRRR